MRFMMFDIMFTLVFSLIAFVVITGIIKGIREWNTNNHSPRLTVSAVVVSKRTQVSHHHHASAEGIHHHHTSTTYYVTFEVDSGDRMEMHVSAKEYGQLIEGDTGDLTFQGTRYLGFERL